ncbi:MAG: hypothetical protein QF824_01580, partial [Candidatus Woesearchaeota archaeon]|nr:hypothetical protein [Candidatus Woesearchaeota archaeon]
MKKLKLMIMGLYLLIVVSATMVSSFESDVTFDYNPTNPEVGEGVTFNIEVINEDNSIVDYEWSFGESGRGTVGTSTSGTGLSLTGKTHWVDTGMDFSEGDILSIEASGTMMFDSDGRASNPDGQVNPSSDSIARVDGNGNCKHLLCGDDVASSALVGRIRNNGLGDYSSGFVVGSDFTKLIGQGGRLYLGYNDGYVRPDRSGLDMGGVGDNSGSFSVTLGRKPGRITHTYSDSGSYNVKLYLMDSNGAEGVITKTITVGTPTDDSEPIQECSDSDDGLNYYRKGITRGPNINGQYLVLEDYCYDGVNGNKVGSGPSLAEFYCLNGDTAYPKYDYICPNGCSDGACLPEEDDAKRDVPPFIIAVSDRASASDVSLMEKLIDELEGQSYDVPSIGVRKLFSEVDALRLNNMVTVAIYQGESVVIVGATSPAEHVLFSYDVMDLLDNYRSMTSGEIRSDSLFDLFIDDEPTPIPIPAPTPRNMQSEPIIGNRNAEVSIIGYMGYNDRFSREAWSTIE